MMDYDKTLFSLKQMKGIQPCSEAVLKVIQTDNLQQGWYKIHIFEKFWWIIPVSDLFNDPYQRLKNELKLNESKLGSVMLKFFRKHFINLPEPNCLPLDEFIQIVRNDGDYYGL